MNKMNKIKIKKIKILINWMGCKNQKFIILHNIMQVYLKMFMKKLTVKIQIIFQSISEKFQKKNKIKVIQ